MKKQEILNLSDNQLDRKVRLVGTKFDRRRKLSDAQLAKIINLVREGKDLNTIAEKFKVSSSTIKYHTDLKYKLHVNFMRAFYPVKVKENALSERVQYKRDLIINNKIKVSTII